MIWCMRCLLSPSVLAISLRLVLLFVASCCVNRSLINWCCSRFAPYPTLGPRLVSMLLIRSTHSKRCKIPISVVQVFNSLKSVRHSFSFQAFGSVGSKHLTIAIHHEGQFLKSSGLFYFFIASWISHFACLNNVL